MPVHLQEEVTLVYGAQDKFFKTFEVRRMMFFLGSSSTGGHFTVAAREQRDGQCQPGDRWSYFDSALPTLTYTVDELTAHYCRDVTGLLLVARDPPTFAAGPLPMPRCASFYAILP